MILDNRKKLIIAIILISILIISFIIYMILNNNQNNININDFIVQNEEEIENEIETNEENKQETITKIAVHITGEVKKEGLIYLQQGSRIADAIKEAGGETKEADLSQINLAYILEDGQKIYIPNKKEKISEYVTKNSGYNVMEKEENKKGEENKVNINTATQEELDGLPGIGPSIAQRIIEYRNENGKFNKIEDLQNVKGIGDAKYNDIKNNVTV